jgi:hypothetical protein
LRLGRHHTKILIHFHRPHFGFDLHTFAILAAIDLRSGTCFVATVDQHRSNPAKLALASSKVKLQPLSSIDRPPCIVVEAARFLGCSDYWNSYCSFLQYFLSKI